jgi:uncharacterized phage protein (TIGR01671 family)
MTKELKFRAWTDNLKNGGEMYYQQKDQYFNPLFSPAGYGLLNPSLKFMQFTGLKDKNGIEVYEGDIISTPHFFNWKITGYEKRKVFFKDGAFGVKENEHGFIALKSLFKGIESSKTYISNYGEIYREFEPMFEVIGNIYQNPELLGGENE